MLCPYDVNNCFIQNSVEVNSFEADEYLTTGYITKDTICKFKISLNESFVLPKTAEVVDDTIVVTGQFNMLVTIILDRYFRINLSKAFLHDPNTKQFEFVHKFDSTERVITTTMSKDTPIYIFFRPNLSYSYYSRYGYAGYAIGTSQNINVSLTEPYDTNSPYLSLLPSEEPVIEEPLPSISVDPDPINSTDLEGENDEAEPEPIANATNTTISQGRIKDDSKQLALVLGIITVILLLVTVVLAIKICCIRNSKFIIVLTIYAYRNEVE